MVAVWITLLLGAAPAHAQALPFTVSVVDWDRAPRERLSRAYTSNVGHEVLYCVQAWDTRAAAAPNVDMLVITDVQRADDGRAHKVADVGEKCVGRDGKALPMIHTHSDGNCQFSPSDLVTIAARNAPFDGVQCGERHFIWAFAWQISALVGVMEERKLASTPQR